MNLVRILNRIGINLINTVFNKLYLSSNKIKYDIVSKYLLEDKISELFLNLEDILKQYKIKELLVTLKEIKSTLETLFLSN